jgi:hypothetical protein
MTLWPMASVLWVSIGTEGPARDRTPVGAAAEGRVPEPRVAHDHLRRVPCRRVQQRAWRREAGRTSPGLVARASYTKGIGAEAQRPQRSVAPSPGRVCHSVPIFI